MKILLYVIDRDGAQGSVVDAQYVSSESNEK